jgi:hypothetical protein
MAARSGPASVLQRDRYAVDRQLEFQAHFRGQELDDHTVFILEVQSCAATAIGNDRGKSAPAGRRLRAGRSKTY